MERVNISLVRALANVFKKLAETEYIEDEFDNSAQTPESDHIKSLKEEAETFIKNEKISSNKKGGFSDDLAKFDKTLEKMKKTNQKSSKTVQKDDKSIEDDFIK